MKYIEEFRDGAVARRSSPIASRREAPADRRYRLMEFCGGHTHALWRYGIVEMLPAVGGDDPRPGLSRLRPAHRPARAGHRARAARRA